MAPALASYALALVLTIAMEVPIAFLFGYRRRDELGAVALVNLMTNPAVNWLLALNSTYLLIPPASALIAIEAAAVLAEWRLLVYVFGTEPRKLLILSIVMNAASYLAGVVIFGTAF